MVIYISTPQDLDNIRNNLTESYELTNDIDMSKFGNWTSIGNSSATSFKGILDGKGFRIKNLTIDTSLIYAGLFGFTENATIMNLGLVDVNIKTTQSYVGALVGRCDLSNVISCYSTGNITGVGSVSQYIGGLLGRITSGTIKDSYSHVNITDVRQRNGGFAGSAGVQVDVPLDFRNCYSTGKITNATGSSNGGFVGLGSSVSTNCYWDTVSSGMSTSAGGATGKTTAQMQTASTFVGWDSEVWLLQDGSYPTLKAFGKEIVSIIEDRNVISYVDNFNSSVMLNKVATVKRVSSIKEFSADTQKIIKAVKVGTTFVKDIVSGVSREVQIVKVGSETVTSYILPITSNIETLKRRVQILDETVTSYIRPITSDVERQIKSLRQSLSFIDVIVGRVITLNLTPKQIKAIVSHMENGTLAHYLNSQYNVSILNDLSVLNTMNNNSSVNTLENQTLSEVRE